MDAVVHAFKIYHLDILNCKGYNHIMDKNTKNLDIKNMLDCLPPCTRACPAQTNCLGYVGLAARGRFSQALKLLKDKIPLPASIGYICPRPCEDACTRKYVDKPIAIGDIKTFVGNHADDNPQPPQTLTGKKIAVIGGGPGGLSCGYFLRQMGHEVDIYDAMLEMGGMLRYGVPSFRLPRKVLAREIDVLVQMGINLHNNMKIGEDLTLDSLRQSHHAVIVACGAWRASTLKCDGEHLDGVLGGVYFLRDIAMDKLQDLKGKVVAVVGGGNTAMDAARAAISLQAKKVYVIYRRTKSQMPAHHIEVEEAEKEGAIFKFLVNPVEILGDGGKVAAVRLKSVDDDVIETLAIDNIIMAIGQKPNLKGLEGITLNDYGNIQTNQSFGTNIPNIFAIGDAIDNGAGIAIEAMADAKKCAAAVDAFLKGQAMPLFEKNIPNEEYPQNPNDFSNIPKKERLKAIATADVEQIIKEAGRCLKCGPSNPEGCEAIKNRSNTHNASMPLDRH